MAENRRSRVVAANRIGGDAAWINPDRPSVHAIPLPETTAYAYASDAAGIA